MRYDTTTLNYEEPLIAIVPSTSGKWKRQAKDAVILSTPIDIPEQLSQLTNSPTPETYFDALSTVELLTGMLNSDGITILSTRGELIGFNWFISTDQRTLSPSQKLGGARHRAFSALEAAVDKKYLHACYIRSSDGAERGYDGGPND